MPVTVNLHNTWLGRSWASEKKAVPAKPVHVLNPYLSSDPTISVALTCRQRSFFSLQKVTIAESHHQAKCREHLVWGAPFPQVVLYLRTCVTRLQGTSWKRGQKDCQSQKARKCLHREAPHGISKCLPKQDLNNSNTSCHPSIEGKCPRALRWRGTTSN